MSERDTVTSILATLIQQTHVPLKAVALAGEIIAMHARLSDVDDGVLKPKPISLESWVSMAETYHALLRRTHTSFVEYMRDQDGDALIGALSEIKEVLAASVSVGVLSHLVTREQ
jgi:hypothetical protein